MIATMPPLLLDNRFTSFVLDQTDFFKNVHPNLITIFGFVCNIILFFTITEQYLILTAAILFLRYTADLLDGGVARKYNKVSKLGGLLDSLSDNALMFVLIYSIGILLSLENSVYIAAITTLLNAGYMISQNSFIDHEPIKQGNKGFKRIYSFFVNNNCVSYTLTYILILTV